MSHLYRARLVKDGPFVAVRTFFDGPLVDGEILDRSPRWQAVVGPERTGRVIWAGEAVPIEVDGVFLREVEGVPAHEYEYLVAHHDWAAANEAQHPRARPRESIDLRRMPSLF